jgi:mRNA-degrading endonuclease YafQ of YafQ-DinJ toxin-antitoxin module
MQYLYTARFLRSLKKCEEAVQDDIVNAVKRFETGKNNKELKLHKLHGKFKSYHAFSANFSYRVIIKMSKQAVYYVDVGTHDIYQ